MTELLAGTAGLIGGICLGTGMIYLLRVPDRILRGMNEVDTRFVGYLVVLLGAISFLSWLIVPWLINFIAAGAGTITHDWLSYSITVSVGVVFVEIAFHGGRRGWFRTTSPALEPRPVAPAVRA